MTSTQEFQQQIGRIEGLVAKMEDADPSTRAVARELVQCIMDLHGAGLERVLEILTKSNAGDTVLESLAHDPLVSSLLVLYSLHPESFEMRARRGVENIRPTLRARDVRLEKLEIEDDSVKLRLVGAVPAELKNAVREALFETVPDASQVEIEGGRPAASAGFVPLASLLSSGSKPELTLV